MEKADLFQNIYTDVNDYVHNAANRLYHDSVITYDDIITIFNDTLDIFLERFEKTHECICYEEIDDIIVNEVATIGLNRAQMPEEILKDTYETVYKSISYKSLGYAENIIASKLHQPLHEIEFAIKLMKCGDTNEAK